MAARRRLQHKNANKNATIDQKSQDERQKKKKYRKLREECTEADAVSQGRQQTTESCAGSFTSCQTNPPPKVSVEKLGRETGDEGRFSQERRGEWVGRSAECGHATPSANQGGELGKLSKEAQKRIRLSPVRETEVRLPTNTLTDASGETRSKVESREARLRSRKENLH